jgi:valyl-tRNA synthetase
MHLSNFDGKKPKKLLFFDRWLLHCLQNVIYISTTNFERYEYSKTKQETEKFFWHAFCDNYLEIVKDRLYNNKRGEDAKRSAQYALYHALLTVLKLMAPITPHITEELYQHYFAEKEKQKSIHTAAWPEVKKKFIDEKIGRQGDIVLDIITAVRRYKSQQGAALNSEIRELIVDGSKVKNFENIMKDAADDVHAVLHVKAISLGKGTLPCDRFPVKITVK